jgi:hypothetical protein
MVLLLHFRNRKWPMGKDELIVFAGIEANEYATTTARVLNTLSPDVLSCQKRPAAPDASLASTNASYCSVSSIAEGLPLIMRSFPESERCGVIPLQP